MFLHVDLDAFFASVEQLDFPEYRGKPVIVGGDPESRRSVVSTCSYEARKFGVHSAMATAQAKVLCPNGIFVHGRMKRYHEKSKEVMEIFGNYSPDVQQMSIDEAFIDLGGTEKLFGPPEQTAMRLKAEVKEKTGLTVSCGLASNKYVAKIASGINKPDGFCFVAPGEEEAFMLGLPLSKLWGAGEKTVEKLKKSGFSSIKDIHSASLELLQSIFGKAGGSFLYMAVRGQAAETFGSDAKNHSISGERTFPYDLTDSYIIETALLQLCTEVQMRMLTENWFSHTIHLKIRYGDFTTVGIQRSYDQNFETENELYERVKSLFYEKWEKGRGIRLLGVGAGNCTHTPSQQFELFERDNQKTKDLEKAVLQINRKNKASGVKLQKARLMEAKNIVPPKER